MKNLQVKNNHKNGFTLIELSIVLVIIGLIVGGVVGGKALIKSSEVHALVTTMDRIKTSVNAFYLQYDALPGDFREAGDYWPNCDSTPANCNGDGDNTVETDAEKYRAWQHLALADILPSSMSGVVNGSGNCEIGVNIMDTPMNGGGLMFNSASYAWWPRRLDMGLQFGSRDNVVHSSCLDNPIVTAAVARKIDRKIDDGLASDGNMFSLDGGGASGECLVDQGGADNNYNVAATEAGCRVFFDIDISS